MLKHCKRIMREVCVGFPEIPEHHVRMTSATILKIVTRICIQFIKQDDGGYM